MSTLQFTRPGFSLLAASTLALAPAAPSAAALVSIGDYADLYFNGSVTARYDDNIFLLPDDGLGFFEKEEDIILIFAPGVELNVGTRGNANVNLYYREDFYVFTDHGDLDTNLSNVFLETYYNQPRLQLRLSGTVQQLIQPTPTLRVVGTEDGGLIERDFYNANLRAEYEISERTSVASGLGGSHVDFHTPGFVDSSSYSVPFNLYYALTPRYDLSTGYRFRKTNTSGDRPNYEDHYFNVGVRGELFPKLMGEARAGYQQRRFDTDFGDSSRDDGLSFGIDLSHFLTPKITLLAGGYRDYETGGQAQSIIATGGSLGARYSFSHLISANAGANFFVRDYDAETGGTGFEAREDETLDLNVGVTYSPTVHVNLSAGYVYRTNNSNVEDFDFSNNIFSLSASLRY